MLIDCKSNLIRMVGRGVVSSWPPEILFLVCSFQFISVSKVLQSHVPLGTYKNRLACIKHMSTTQLAPGFQVILRRFKMAIQIIYKHSLNKYNFKKKDFIAVVTDTESL